MSDTLTKQFEQAVAYDDLHEDRFGRGDNGKTDKA